MDHHTLEEGNTLNIDFQKLKKWPIAVKILFPQ